MDNTLWLEELQEKAKHDPYYQECLAEGAAHYRRCGRGIHKGWCSAQRIKIAMIAGGNHTIMQWLWRAGARHTAPLVSASFRPFLAETRKGQIIRKTANILLTV